MELAKCVHIQEKGRIEIPKEIIKIIGLPLKSTNMNNVMLLITSSGDDRFAGEPLSFYGLAFSFPEDQLSALHIKPGDEVKFVFSDELGFIIMQKCGAEI